MQIVYLILIFRLKEKKSKNNIPPSAVELGWAYESRRPDMTMMFYTYKLNVSLFSVLASQAPLSLSRSLLQTTETQRDASWSVAELAAMRFSSSLSESNSHQLVYFTEVTQFLLAFPFSSSQRWLSSSLRFISLLLVIF